MLKYLTDKSQSSLATNHADVNSRKFQDAINHLEHYKFWSGDRAGILSLWQSQQSAIALGAAYLNANNKLPNENNVTEAALVKMPTGTGKSGVIAALTRCLPEVKMALVLTPRIALTTQLFKDIRYRFWGHLGFKVPQEDDGNTWHADKATAGEKIDDALILHLLPSSAEEILNAISKNKNGRNIIVGTLQAFDTIRRDLDKLDLAQRRGRELNEEESNTYEIYSLFLSYIRENFDLVVVDEGHYEPAPSWSRSVRNLDLPTILFSATPFRNDYKLFRVRGRFVFNMPFDEAAQKNIIRSVKFMAPPVGKPQKKSERRVAIGALEGDTTTKRSVTKADRDEVAEFVDLLSKKVPEIVKVFAVIVAVPSAKGVTRPVLLT